MLSIYFSKKKLTQRIVDAVNHVEENKVTLEYLVGYPRHLLESGFGQMLVLSKINAQRWLLLLLALISCCCQLDVQTTVLLQFERHVDQLAAKVDAHELVKMTLDKLKCGAPTASPDHSGETPLHIVECELFAHEAHERLMPVAGELVYKFALEQVNVQMRVVPILLVGRVVVVENELVAVQVRLIVLNQ